VDALEADGHRMVGFYAPDAPVPSFILSGRAKTTTMRNETGH
jgi:hypothetical protein